MTPFRFAIASVLTVLFLPLLVHAQGAPPIDLANITLSSVAALLVWAVQHKAWRYLVAGFLVGVAWLVRKLQSVPMFSEMALFKWFNTDRGGAVLVLFLSEAGGLSTALMMPTFSWMHLVDAASLALAAVGGYTVLRKIFKPSDKANAADQGLVEIKQSGPAAQSGFFTVTLGGGLAAAGIAFAVLACVGCATVGPAICGEGKTLVPPDAKACSSAFLQAAASIATDVAACRVEPAGTACIDAVLASVADLTPCEPTCGPMGAASAKLATVHTSVAVKRANIIESLKATGAGH